MLLMSIVDNKCDVLDVAGCEAAAGRLICAAQAEQSQSAANTQRGKLDDLHVARVREHGVRGVHSEAVTAHCSARCKLLEFMWPAWLHDALRWSKQPNRVQ